MKRILDIGLARVMFMGCAGNDRNISLESSVEPTSESTDGSTDIVETELLGLHVEFAEDVDVEIEDGSEVLLDPDNADVGLVFLTDRTVTDLEIVELTFLDVDQQGEILWYAETVYSQPELTADDPLLVIFPAFGDMPSYGIEFTDTDGTRITNTIGISGMDGSLFLDYGTFVYDMPEEATQAYVTAEFAPDELPDNSTLYVIGDEEDPDLRVMFTTDQTVTGFEVLVLGMSDIDQNGNIIWDKQIEYMIPEFTPEEPLVVYAPNPGDLPSLGISYTDIDGTERFFVLSISGYDGSLVMSEEPLD